MPTVVYYITASGRTNLYLFPVDQSLAAWNTYKVPLVEDAAPNLGRYAATVSVNQYPSEWIVFEDDAQPGQWNESVGAVNL